MLYIQNLSKQIIETVHMFYHESDYIFFFFFNLNHSFDI